MYFNTLRKEITEEKFEQLSEIKDDFTQLMYKINKLQLPILIDFRVVEDRDKKYSDGFYINLLAFKKAMRAICGLRLETAFPLQYKELNYDFENGKLYSQDL